MKRLLHFIPLVAFLSLSCSTTTNNSVSSSQFSLAPTITGFSPDTVWTLQPLTIHGTHFGLGYNVLVWIDTTPVYQWSAVDDTEMNVTVPEGAHTGLIRVWSYEQTASSAKPVVVNYTFNPHGINDTVPTGGSFSIPGTGMNHSHGSLLLQVGNVSFSIDSVFPDRIVSHAAPMSCSGNVFLSDSSGRYSCGSLTVTRPSAWTTLSVIDNYLVVTETHHRFGYVNGPAHPIDSTWTTTATYAGQHNKNIAGIPFIRNTTGLQYYVPPFSITWDTIKQQAQVSYYESVAIPATPTHSIDTEWGAGPDPLPGPLPVDNNIEFVLPDFGYSIYEHFTDTQGLVNWAETTYAQVKSGQFDLVFKH